jgi:hypothetical protein
MAATAKNFFLVTIDTPTSDLRRRSEEDIAATQWLDDLRIVADL